MLDALTLGDFETVERLGHNMKGAGASFGFQAITDIGAALEQEAGSVDIDASRKWVDELSTYLDRVGLGAEIAVLLPLPTPARSTAEACAPTAGGARRIVLVEDNDDLREGFRAVLEDRGHHVNGSARRDRRTGAHPRRKARRRDHRHRPARDGRLRSRAAGTSGARTFGAARRDDGLRAGERSPRGAIRRLRHAHDQARRHRAGRTDAGARRAVEPEARRLSRSRNGRLPKQSPDTRATSQLRRRH